MLHSQGFIMYSQGITMYSQGVTMYSQGVIPFKFTPWKMSSLENVPLENVLSGKRPSGKCPLWKMSSLENVRPGKSPLWKMSSLENVLTPKLLIQLLYGRSNLSQLFLV